MADQPDRENQQNNAENEALNGATGASKKQTGKKRNNGGTDEKSKPTKWKRIWDICTLGDFRRIELKDRLMILSTIGVMLVAGITGLVFVRQENIMQRQFEEMQRQTTILNGQVQQGAKDSIEASGKVERQLKILQRQATAAQRSASAAETNARTSEESLRGYLSVEEIRASAIESDKPSSFVIIWKNDGNSPATLTKSITNIGSSDVAPTRKSCPPGNIAFEPIVVNPHSTRLQTARATGLKPSKYIFLCGTAVYNTMGKEYSFPLCSFRTPDLGLYENCPDSQEEKKAN